MRSGQRERLACGVSKLGLTAGAGSGVSEGGADRVGHHGTSLTHGTWPSGCGVAFGLVLDLRIELGTDDDDDCGDPEPGHEAENGAERSVGGVVRSKRRDVPGEKAGGHQDDDHRQDRAGRDPPPLCSVPRRAEAIERGQTSHHQQEHKDQAASACRPLGGGPKADELQDGREHHDKRYQEQDRGKRRQREDHGHGGQSDVAPLLLLVVGDIHRLEHRLHTGIRAPQGDGEGDQRRQPELRLPLLRQTPKLLANDVEAAARDQTFQQVHVPVEGHGVRKEAVDGDERCQRRHQGEQGVECHARRDQHHVVADHFIVGPPQNVLPSGRRISATFDAPRPRASCWATVVGMVVLRRRTTIQGAGAPKVPGSVRPEARGRRHRP